MAGNYRRWLIPLGLLVAALLAPAVVRAQTHTFINTNNLSQTDFTGGPANLFPSPIAVSGLPGTMTKATVTLFGFSAAYPDDMDVVISGPNGSAVTLVSDACGPNDVTQNTWTFDDAAEPLDLPNEGTCASSESATYSPTRWLPEDNLSPFGGPPPPYSGALASLAGGSPNGVWSLWVLDDDESNTLTGFSIAGWALTLAVTPPPSAQSPTGQRAAALARCKRKKNRKARKRCRRKANQLPV